MGKKLGDSADPLLVSVRSGAKFSMPGMMDTILNLGLNDRSVEGLKSKTSNGRFAKDSYRRFIQMFGNVVLGIDKERFDHELNAVKKNRKAKADPGSHGERLRRGDPALQGGGAEGDGRALPAGPARAARRARATPCSAPG
jgi:pyruvate,orthophosphate dikinase